MMTASIFPAWFATWLEDLIRKAVFWLTSWIHDLLQLFIHAGDYVTGELINAVSAAIPSLSAVAASEYVQKINAFFPLSETMAFVTVYLVFYLVAMAYRAIKSWVPTVSGS
jgi:hypothetical protein